MHWLELSAALRKTLDVQQVKGWDHVQCQVARAVARDPDKKERQRHDPALSAISACLIDIDTVDAQGITRHQLLAGAAVLKGRYQDRDLLMMYTVEDGYEAFDSLAQLGASLRPTCGLPLGHDAPGLSFLKQYGVRAAHS